MRSEVTACALLLVLVVQTSAAKLQTNGSLDVLKCVYQDWFLGTQLTPITSQQLDDHINCCRGLLGKERLFSFLLLDFRLIKYNALFNDGSKKKADTGIQPTKKPNCHFEKSTKSISTSDLRNYVCNISAEFGKISDLEWPKTIEHDSFLLTVDGLRNAFIDQLFQIYDRILTAALTNQHCYILLREDFQLTTNMSSAEKLEVFDGLRNVMYSFMEKHIQFISYAMMVVQKLIVPYSYEKLGRNITTEELDSWIKSWQKVGNFLHGRMGSYISDNIGLNKEIFKANLTEDPKTPGNYILKWPIPRAADITFGDIESGRSDCWKGCDKHGQSLLQGLDPLANIEYAFYTTWLPDQVYFYVTSYLRSGSFGTPFLKFESVTADDVWPLKDQGNTTVLVDAKCVQLMRELIDNPQCPIDDVPEDIRFKQKRCKLQLENDLRQQLSYVPITGSIAHNEKHNINLCLLSWMITNSNSICENVLPSFSTSAEAAYCFFNSSKDGSCEKINFTKDFCSIFREILWFKCRKYIPVFIFPEIDTKAILRDYEEDVNRISLK